MGGPKQSPYTRKVWPIQTFCVNFDFWQRGSFLKNYGSSTELKVVTRPSFWYGLDILQSGQKSPKNFYGISLQKEPEEWKEGPFFRAFNTLFKLVIFG